MSTDKIQPYHLAKPAYIYLRQSSMGQVRFNQESTERQYALQNRAQQMGWSSPAIKVLDGDLGLSGTQSTTREDFKTLVVDVSMGKVGAVFALEASRLSRSCADWHRLLELCAMTNTLLIDEDGCYNLSDFNDQLLLNFKGSMSFAELHLLRSRLHGGKLNKAKKGELKSALAIGFCYDEKNRIRLDPDKQVRDTLHLFFKIFREKGSVYGVVCYFEQNKIQFPYKKDAWQDKILWGRLTYSHACIILRNPTYAGVFAYGRRRSQKRISEKTGQLKKRSMPLPVDQWPVMIKDHHEGYISWDEYLEHNKIINQNSSRMKESGQFLSTSAREGSALLQGLLLCRLCGHSLTTIYYGNGGIYASYFCGGRLVRQKACVRVSAAVLDEVVAEKVLMAITPMQIEIAVKAFEELECRGQALEKQWVMKIERVHYEAKLAQRRYEEVDPSNRLVASTLEKEWNDALVQLEEAKSQYADYQKENLLTLTATKKQKENILALAKDFPRLWNAPSTSAKDRKRILRLLIKDITIKKSKKEDKAHLYIRWQGGAVEELEVPIPLPNKRLAHSDKVIGRVRTLACTMADQEIVEQINQEGLKTPKGTSFTLAAIRGIRVKHKIPPAVLQKQDELSVNQTAKKFGVRNEVVRYWVSRNMVKARRTGSRIWITLDSEKEAELIKKVENSTRLTPLPSLSRSKNLTARSAL